MLKPTFDDEVAEPETVRPAKVVVEKPPLAIESATPELNVVDDAMTYALSDERYPVVHAFAAIPRRIGASWLVALGSPIVVRPVFETEKSVVVAAAVDDAMTKILLSGKVSYEYACTESVVIGDVVPIPRRLLVLFQWK